MIETTSTEFLENRNKLRELISRHSMLSGDSFQLTSGLRKARYFDMKSSSMDPATGNIMCKVICSSVSLENYSFLAGVVMGGVPMVARLTEYLYPSQEITGLIVRQEAKAHGTGKIIEGVRDLSTIRDRNVLVVEDVTTTGGSIARAVGELRERGAVVDSALTVVRRTEDASRNLGDIGVKLIFVFEENEFDAS